MFILDLSLLEYITTSEHLNSYQIAILHQIEGNPLLTKMKLTVIFAGLVSAQIPAFAPPGPDDGKCLLEATEGQRTQYSRSCSPRALPRLEHVGQPRSSTEKWKEYHTGRSRHRDASGDESRRKPLCAALPGSGADEPGQRQYHFLLA